MKIDRTNYEEWLQDWLDDNLTGPESEELESFLEINPDIRTEFEGMDSLKLDPGKMPSFNKNHLKRELKNIPASQFELLCAAYIEDDLDDEQKAEVDEIISSDREKKKLFNALSAMKLNPPQCSFQNKELLFKKESSGRIYYLLLAGLSAAAIIALVLLTGVIRKTEQGHQEVIAGGEKVIYGTQSIEAGKKTSPLLQKNHSSEGDIRPEENIADSDENKPAFSEVITPPEREPFIITRADIPPSLPLADEMTANLLVSSENKYMKIENYDYRSNTGKFISRVFRKEILKEEMPSESPINAYEIAEAGIKGMNKLLGWDMAISRNTGENGEIKSVYFNSRVLSFRAPVKKNENGE